MTYVPDSQVWFEPYLMGYFYSKYGKHRSGITKIASDLWKIDESLINDQNTHLDGIAGKLHFFVNDVIRYHNFIQRMFNQRTKITIW